MWQIASQAAVGERDSTTLLATVALGGDYARVRTEARLDGQGASARQIALYFGEADQMHDFRTMQDHMSRRGRRATCCSRARSRTGPAACTPASSRSATRPVARSPSRPTATSRCPTEAWAESVPNLDIETNDVKCSHACTVGPVDDEQRFYLESRGVPPDDRRAADRARLLRRGARPAPGARIWCPALRRQVMAKLDRRDARDDRRHRDVGPLSPTSCPAPRKRVEVDGHAIALVRIGDDVYAIGDTCSHANVSLSEGEVVADVTRDRVLEARQHLLPRDGRAPDAAGHAARAGVRGPRSTTAMIVVVLP